ncbi:MAG: glutamine synthetase [Nisaea sp.]|uniref:glutamine synthetase family protein n=1 Tax=Nisaea sp. TaxID=2024842 RepID=UPI001B0FD854|nr:glutamine synthetase family protein [Nisaea sp.]MBO6560786.1 glutamine synthetase [Nisaea sp.]
MTASDGKQAAIDAVLKRVAEEGLEVVRISFADQHGILRGKTIMADSLESAFRSGIAMTSTLLLKDTSHRTVFPVWQEDAGFGPGRLTGAGDVLMRPDPATFRVLPWSPHSSWMQADLTDTDGNPLEVCSRGILRRAVEKLNTQGYDLVTGLEVEFHVLRVIDPKLGHDDTGQPETPPETELLAHGYQYLTEDRYDRLEEVFDLVRRNAVALGLPVRSFETEFGPSQCEVTFHPASATEHADNMVLFRSMVKQVCRREGLHATFMCRPKFKDAMASGWHLHQSLVDLESGDNLMVPEEGEALSKPGRSWVAGLLEHAAEGCLLSTPTVNGYKRYRPFTLAPDRVQWGRDNKGAMIRALARPGDGASRIENRIGEPAANPYLYIASQILAGLDGVERGLEAPAPVERPYESDAARLPTSLDQALALFRGSSFFRAALGDAYVDYYSRIKQAEWDRYAQAVSEWEEREYFSLF